MLNVKMLILLGLALMMPDCTVSSAHAQYNNYCSVLKCSPDEVCLFRKYLCDTGTCPFVYYCSSSPKEDHFGPRSCSNTLCSPGYVCVLTTRRCKFGFCNLGLCTKGGRIYNTEGMCKKAQRCIGGESCMPMETVCSDPPCNLSEACLSNADFSFFTKQCRMLGCGPDACYLKRTGLCQGDMCRRLPSCARGSVNNPYLIPTTCNDGKTVCRPGEACMPLEPTCLNPPCKSSDVCARQKDITSWINHCSKMGCTVDDCVIKRTPLCNDDSCPLLPRCAVRQGLCGTGFFSCPPGKACILYESYCKQPPCQIVRVCTRTEDVTAWLERCQMTGCRADHCYVTKPVDCKFGRCSSAVRCIRNSPGAVAVRRSLPGVKCNNSSIECYRGELCMPAEAMCLQPPCKLQEVCAHPADVSTWLRECRKMGCSSESCFLRRSDGCHGDSCYNVPDCVFSTGLHRGPCRGYVCPRGFQCYQEQVNCDTPPCADGMVCKFVGYTPESIFENSSKESEDFLDSDQQQPSFNNDDQDLSRYDNEMKPTLPAVNGESQPTPFPGDEIIPLFDNAYLWPNDTKQIPSTENGHETITVPYNSNPRPTADSNKQMPPQDKPNVPSTLGNEMESTLPEENVYPSLEADLLKSNQKNEEQKPTSEKIKLQPSPDDETTPTFSYANPQPNVDQDIPLLVNSGPEPNHILNTNEPQHGIDSVNFQTALYDDNTESYFGDDEPYINSDNFQTALYDDNTESYFGDDEPYIDLNNEESQYTPEDYIEEDDNEYPMYTEEYWSM